MKREIKKKNQRNQRNSKLEFKIKHKLRNLNKTYEFELNNLKKLKFYQKLRIELTEGLKLTKTLKNNQNFN